MTMLPATNTTNEIEAQEEEIFREIDNYGFHLHESLLKTIQAKQFARQQLELSADSPFNRTASTAGETSDRKQSLAFESELKKLKQQRAAILEKETKEIRQKLDYVKSKLNEMNLTSSSPSSNPATPLNSDSEQQTLKAKRESSTQDQSSKDSNCNSNEDNNNRPPTKHHKCDRQQQDHMLINEERGRPLTGRMDCPNCNCDRRTSVCDYCIEINATRDRIRTPVKENSEVSPPQQLPGGAIIKRQPSMVILSDERPIRPSQMITRITASNEHQSPKRTQHQRKASAINNNNTDNPSSRIDDLLVPGRVYAISRSLNEKRSKLATVIDDLQLMIDRVKMRGQRLDEERKVAQLYRDQWKLGPRVGGPSAPASPTVSRDQVPSNTSSIHQLQKQSFPGAVQSNSRLRNRNYESRLDPNLARDTKSLMGFQSINSSLRLRQYPRMGPINERHKSMERVRWKSLESLPKHDANNHRSSASNSPFSSSRRATFNKQTTTTSAFDRNKASSDSNLDKEALELPDEESEYQKDEGDVEPIDDDEGGVEFINVDEQFEEPEADPTSPSGVSVDQTDKTTARRGQEFRYGDASSADQNRVKHQQAYNDHDAIEVGAKKRSSPSVQNRVSWIPVFGETEIKTVKQRPANQRKVTIIEDHEKREGSVRPRTGYGMRPSQHIATRIQPKATSLGTRNWKSTGSLAGDRVILAASKQLRAASNLLEAERRDAQTKNQILVVNKRVPIKSSSDNGQPGNSQSGQQRHQDNNRSARSNDQAPKTTISQLEAKIIEQQNLLKSLLDKDTKMCQNSTCCCSSSRNNNNNPQPITKRRHQAHSSASSTSSSFVTSRNQLIANLRDKLNKTKVRLARTLEQEREKHQQLKMKMDNSMRKQSDLVQENEILKQSLNKCIDTCLKDILSTFESLNETLGPMTTQSTHATSSSATLINGDDKKLQLINNNNQPPEMNSNKDEDNTTRSTSTIDSSVVEGNQLTNAAQLINEKAHLRHMKSHIDRVESQRRGMFEELNKEKQRSQLLELQLIENQTQLARLAEAKSLLESQLMVGRPSNDQVHPAHIESPLPSTSANAKLVKAPEQQNVTEQSAILSDDDNTYNSVEVYRRFIQSISPDIESIRRDRRQITSEIDNIKKILSDNDAMVATNGLECSNA